MRSQEIHHNGQGHDQNVAPESVKSWPKILEWSFIVMPKYHFFNKNHLV